MPAHLKKIIQTRGYPNFWKYLPHQTKDGSLCAFFLGEKERARGDKVGGVTIPRERPFEGLTVFQLQAEKTKQ